MPPIQPIQAQVIEKIASLQDSDLVELLNFIEFLQWRSQQPTNPTMSVTRVSVSGEQSIAADGQTCGKVVVSEGNAMYVTTDSDAIAPPSQGSNPIDPFVGGLFSGSPNLATQAETILQQEALANSGWSWKQ